MLAGDMVKQDYFTSGYLGYINFAFFMGCPFLGQFGDRMNLRIFILSGSFITSVITSAIFTIFGVMIEIQKKMICTQYFIIKNGISQSTAWFELLDIFGDIYADSLVGRDHLPLYARVYLAAVSLFIINLIKAFFLLRASSADIKKQMIEEYEKNKINQLKLNDQQLTIALIEQQFEPNLNTPKEENKKEVVNQQQPSLNQTVYKHQPSLNIYQQQEQLNYLTT
ncbi:unnamed protein product [Paramecium sonneborni]|uniref:Uncharacterized protein n=1 Tax=Paramecium sonneborni TaxID=65129 RepID=A0A8S1QBN8_9CILI|nr:unnamed protein product [Paramecium sonneborni]